MSAPLSEAPVYAPSGAVVRCGRHGSPVIPVDGNYTSLIALSAAGAADPYAAVPPGELGYYPNVPFGIEGYEGAKHQYWTADSTHGDMVVNGGDTSGNSNQDTFAYNPATRVFTKILGNNDVGAFAFDRSIIQNAVGSLTVVGGSGYVNGFYPDGTGVTGVPLLGGTGYGASAWIQVSNGVAALLSRETGFLVTSGYGYTAGDVLTINNADLGGSGAGFSVTVNAVSAAGTPSTIIAPIGRCLPGIRHDPTRNVIWLEGGSTRPRVWASNMKRGGLWALNRDSTPPVWTHQGPGAVEAFGSNADAFYSTGMFYDLAGDSLYTMISGTRIYKYPLTGITIDGISRNLWQRFSTTVRSGYSYGCYDSLRRRIIYFNETSTGTYAWDCATDTEQSIGPTGFPQTYVDYHLAYDTSLDRVVFWAAADNWEGHRTLRHMYWMDPNGVWTAFTPDGDKLFEDDVLWAQNTGEYDPVTKCVVMQISQQEAIDRNFLNSRASIHHLYSPTPPPINTDPAWRQGLTPNTWNLVQTNQLTALSPAKDPTVNPLGSGPDAPWNVYGGQHHVVTAWCGGEWDEAAKALHIWGGGHADYGGNEKYLWDAATGLFVRQSKPFGCIGNEGTVYDGLEATSLYADGQPRSFHTYNNFAMRNGVLWAFGGSPATNGGNAGKPFYWNGASWTLDVNTALHTDFGGSCYDSLRDKFWIFRSGIANVQWYSPVTKTKAYGGGYCNSAGGANKPFYNARRDIIFLSAIVPHVMSGGCTTDSVAITRTGTPPPNWRGEYGVAYDEPNDRYLFWESGATIYVLTPPPVGQNPKTATWTWSTLPLDPANTITPVRAAAGTYGRFWYSPSLRCCGVVNSVSQYMHVFPLD